MHSHLAKRNVPGHDFQFTTLILPFAFSQILSGMRTVDRASLSGYLMIVGRELQMQEPASPFPIPHYRWHKL